MNDFANTTQQTERNKNWPRERYFCPYYERIEAYKWILDTT